MKLSRLLQQRLRQISSDNNAQIYRIDLRDIKFNECSYFFDTLNEEEQHKASRMIYSAGQKFITCRAICKKILSEKLKIEDINFSYSERGKPYIIGHENFFFNISHSNNIGIIGISTKSQIGVDIEFIDEKCDFKKLMDIFMFANEKQWVLEKESVYRFFTLWTVKEAVLKQTGDGISIKGFPQITIENNEFRYDNRKIENLFIEEKRYVLSVCI